jgi:ribonuclease HI/exonuclease III
MDSNDKIKIWQQNINKSPACQHDLISSGKLSELGIDIIALQEPAVNMFNQTIATRNWITVYPTTHNSDPGKTRSITLIRAELSTDSWNQIDFPSGDVTVVQLIGTWGKLNIFNIYNEGKSNTTTKLLTKFHKDNQATLTGASANNAHTLWLGDFNRHHPYWDDPRDTRLFTNEAIKEAEVLIEAVAEVGLEMALPCTTPTHYHNVTKQWTRLDQVFLSDHSENILIACDTLPDQRGVKTDHLPVITELKLAVNTDTEQSIPNFRNVDWTVFREALEKNLAAIQPAHRITCQRQLDRSCESLTHAIQATIREQVPVTNITSKSKRWWTKELTELRRQAGKLGRQSYTHRNEPEHRVHAEHKEAVKRYDKTLQYTKKQHWRDWLEKAEDPDIWTASKLVSAPASDGGKARIPSLKHSIDGLDVVARTNNEKSQALAKCFFPAKPSDDTIPQNHKYPRQCKYTAKITPEQIRGQLNKLKPYKAPGPDGIPNIVLTKCADMLTDRLLLIYVSMLEGKLMYKPWKSFTTIVLRKPGKPKYDIPKAYRPIALLNTMWKVITAIIAGQLTHVAEKNGLLPTNHFGGRPGRTTTDAMHLLTNTIKTSWRAGKVTSVLFLDIEGAFPNAVPSRLIHNLRKRRVPNKIAIFIHNMLHDRITTLKFDGFMSEPIGIDNGIGQGDPLSMILYQFYNADLLDIPNEKGESAIAYVDDTLLLATAETFYKTHEMLAGMMSRPGGVDGWSRDHNSPLEYSKLALLDFAHVKSEKVRPPLTLTQRVVLPSESTKYLGVIFDQNLNWNVQHARAIGKGASWTSQIRRLTRPTWGATPKHARRLYISVAIPRILYAADVWCAPTDQSELKSTVGANIIKRLTTVQRSGTLAITGGLRTSPTDALDACAFLLPAPFTIDKWQHRALVRMAMLPNDHPLYGVVARKNTGKIKSHKAPINKLLATYSYDTTKFEKIPATARDPTQIGKLPFQTHIATCREDSIEEAANASEEVIVYTDGSAMNGKVGAAAVLTRADNPPRTLRLHLGPEKEHTVHEAELTGILLALQLINTEKHGNTSFAISVDNQAAIQAFHSELRNPGHHLAREIIKTANQIQKRRRKGMYSLIIRWTAGHEGIEGNETADEEAKKAARGQSSSSDKPLLPPYLRKHTLINSAAIKRAHLDKLKSKWASEWKASERGQKAKLIDSSTPSKKFLNAISHAELSREAASRIAQLRLTHAPVNQFLKRIKKVDSSRCPACGAEEETIGHFLLFCPNYAYERWALAQKANKLHKHLSLETLLGIPDMVVPLAKYVEATGRFKSNAETTMQPTTTQSDPPHSPD